jgi:hypothetical protein
MRFIASFFVRVFSFHWGHYVAAYCYATKPDWK